MSTIIQHNDQFNAKAIAGLMLVQMTLGLLLNFYFLRPVFAYDGSTPVEDISIILGCATLVALLNSSINLAFGLLLPITRIKNYYRTFTSLIVFASVGIALCAYEYANLAEYVTFIASPFANDSNMEFLRKTLASGRNEAHFLSIFISSCSLAVFYMLLIRSELLPKWLSYFALASCLLQLIAVGHTFFQAEIPNVFQLPLAITQLLVPIYLLSAGFAKLQRSDEDSLQVNS